MYKEIKKIAISALLVALGVVFSRFLSIPLSLGGTYSFNLGFGLLPIILLCVLFGPVYGAIGAFAWDLIGALLFPQGAFVIWFTLAAGLFGLVTGMFFIKNARPTILRIAAATACGQIIYSVLLNSFLISTLYSVPFMVLFVPRVIENAIMIVLNTALVSALVLAVNKANILPERFTAQAESDIASEGNISAIEDVSAPLNTDTEAADNDSASEGNISASAPEDREARSKTRQTKIRKS